MVQPVGSMNSDAADSDDGELWLGHARGGQAGEGREGALETRPELTMGQLVRIASGMLGLMFGWAMKTVLTTPLFRDVYGVDPADLGFVWLAGPLSGLVVQPVIGVISDHREGQGQRSFFFAVGTIFMAASLALLPAAGAVSRWLGWSSGTSPSGSEETGTGLAVVALWLLDLAMNASLVAIRAVVADCAPPSQQPKANTVVLISYGAGTLLGYGFSAIDAASWLGLPPGAFWKSCIDFWVAATVLLMTSAVASVEAFRLERPPARTRPRRRHARHNSSSSHEEPSDIQSARSQGDTRGTYCSVVNEGDCHIRHRKKPSPDEDHTYEEPHPIPVPAEAAKEQEWIGTEARQRDTNGVVGSNGVGGVAAGGVSGGGREEDQRQSEENNEEHESTVQRDADVDADLLGLSGEEEGRRGGRRAQRLVTLTRGVESDVVVTGFEEVHSEQAESPAVELEASAFSMQVRLLDMALFYDLPAWLRPVCMLLFFSWIGWFAIIIFGSDWVGVNVFGGDPSAPSGDSGREAYEDGVAWASVGLAIQAVVVTAMGCGPVTLLVRKAGLKGSFLVAAASQSACLLCAAFLGPGAAGRALSLVLLAVLGVPLALVESLPYMMVGMFSPCDSHGQLLGKLNVWIGLAQLALTLCVHPIVKHSQDGDAAVLIAGALAATVGLLFVPAIGGEGTTMASVAVARAPECGNRSPPSPRRLLLEPG